MDPLVATSLDPRVQRRHFPLRGEEMIGIGRRVVFGVPLRTVADLDLRTVGVLRPEVLHPHQTPLLAGTVLRRGGTTTESGLETPMPAWTAVRLLWTWEDQLRVTVEGVG